ncbi:hypothetical protein CU097_012623 [Rhizopus azygosporus]|uniref:Uncharacterized protein n=1 Tax=Rhizopus azygosporus TaxID=86630 RepID=A0A367K219_RHIAZ|nr:hypothetical protein CU097_012623 [Rhizopus azygosporus]
MATLLITATVTHRNPMTMHLAVIHPLLIWIYVIHLSCTGFIPVIGTILSFNASYGSIVFFNSIYWVNTIVNIYIGQTINFILFITNRQETIRACNLANTSQNESSNDLLVLLDLKLGSTFGFVDCNQAAQTGLIGLGSCLFVGCIFTTWYGFIINKWTRSLDKNHIGWRARNAAWNDHLDDLASTYVKDRQNAPTYSTEKETRSFSSMLKKFFQK